MCVAQANVCFCCERFNKKQLWGGREAVPCVHKRPPHNSIRTRVRRQQASLSGLGASLAVEEHREHRECRFTESIERRPVSAQRRSGVWRRRRVREQRHAHGVKLAGVEPHGCARRAALDAQARVPLASHESVALRTVARSRIWALRTCASRFHRYLVGRKLRLGDRRPGNPESVTMATRSRRPSVDVAPNHLMSIYGTTQIHRSPDNVCFCCKRSHKMRLWGLSRPSSR
jgi:hypothetical protein